MAFTYYPPSFKHVISNQNNKVDMADSVRNPGDIIDDTPEILVHVLEEHREKYGNKSKFRVPQSIFDDLYLNFRPFLVFGSLIGLVPIQGFWQRDFEKLTYNNKSNIHSYICLMISLLLGVNCLVGITALANGTAIKAFDYAWAPAMLIFYSTGVYVYVYFYRFSSRLVSIINKWNRLQLHFTQPDLYLYRDTNLIAGLIMTSAILENAVVHLKQFPVVPPSESKGWGVLGHCRVKVLEAVNGSAWEVYYSRSHRQWADLVPYHISAAIYVFVSNKLALYAWDYSDLIVMLLSRAMYFKFKALYVQGQALLFNGHASPTQWQQFTQDHELLCDVLRDVGLFLSPLIFISYGTNIYFVCLQFNLGLAPSGNTSLVSTVYAVWSFVHLTARVFLITLFGSRVHEWAHRVTELFRKCSTEMYISEVERTDRYVSTNTIALHGFSCFTITMPLILQIIGVIFTFEIVLLQASPHKCPCGEGNNNAAGANKS